MPGPGKRRARTRVEGRLRGRIGDNQQAPEGQRWWWRHDDGRQAKETEIKHTIGKKNDRESAGYLGRYVPTYLGRLQIADTPRQHTRSRKIGSVCNVGTGPPLPFLQSASRLPPPGKTRQAQAARVPKVEHPPHEIDCGMETPLAQGPGVTDTHTHRHTHTDTHTHTHSHTEVGGEVGERL